MLALIGLVGGGVCMYFLLEGKRRTIESLRAAQDAESEELQRRLGVLKAHERSLEAQRTEFRQEQAKFESKSISYHELRNENGMLKRDLQNLDISLNKLDLDVECQRQRQEDLDRRSEAVGQRYLKDTIKWTSTSLTPNNFSASKHRLLNVIQWCREIGFEISPSRETELVDNLKAEYEGVVRAAFEREEQARIKAQIREEQRLQNEIDRELKQLERERAAIQAALDQALAEAMGQHSAEVERLQARLAEAEAKEQRAISQAQLTKSGHVYVISNIGSFGPNVFKVGLTRRLEPLERVRELGSASVPFPFDVHMMIASDDAPALENVLHRALHKTRLNKANPRKEFFKSDIESICQIVKEHHGDIQYVADPEALEYRQSLDMPEEDIEFIEHVYDEIEEQDATYTAEE